MKINSNHILIWFAVLIAGLAGFLLASGLHSGKIVDTHNHAADMHHGESMKDGEHMEDSHNMEMVVVPEGALAPTVDLVLHKDPKGGYNAEIKTTNFSFAPERASTEHVFGEGHAHIYVDGVKINRVYGNWYHLASLGESGTHEVRVELSANSHAAYMNNGVKIEDSETVVVE